MNRTIPIAMSLALMTSYAWAEDKEGASAQQDQAQSQRDAAAGADAAASQDASATATDDSAQPAAGRQAGQQDPTKMFITDMYSHNLYEIQLSQMAEKQAQDPQVKQLAQMLIKDHTQANQELKQIAQSAGAQVQEKLDPVHQAKLQKHQQCPPAEFSRKYANDQVAGHTMAVLELTYQAKNAKDQKVKQFATKMLPKMEQHLKQATEIAMTQAQGMGGGGEAQPASERQPAEQPQDGASSEQPGASGQDAAGQSDSSSGQSK